MRIRRFLLMGTTGLLVAGGGLGFWIFRLPTFGGNFTGARLERMQASPEWKQGRFENTPPQDTPLALMQNLREYFGGQKRSPEFPIPVQFMRAEDFTAPPALGLRAYWFGHASVFVEIDGLRVMTDPVFSEYVSPLAVAVAPRRMHPVPLALELMPKIDAVVISHDHYDHLDMASIQALARKGTHFYVGLGIGAHLERWEVPAPQIHEMDWWESVKVGEISIDCLPARHYSGRKRMDNSTLWTSWRIASPGRSVYFSGDTGYSPHFAEIRRRKGPVDLALVKVGAYGSTWLDIHMDPESAVKAARDLGAARLLPVHWGTFNLAYHDWAEPVERTLAVAQGLDVAVPRPGERVEYGVSFRNAFWWRKPGL